MLKTRFLQSFVLIGLAIFLLGCPYESPYSLDEQPKVPIDTSILGKWMVQDSPEDGGDINYYTFTKFNEKEYLMQATDSTEKGDVGYFRMFISEIKSQKILNVQELVGSRHFMLFQYRFDAENNMYFSWAIDSILKTETINSSKDLRKAVTKKLKEGNLFSMDNEMKFIRQEE